MKTIFLIIALSLSIFAQNNLMILMSSDPSTPTAIPLLGWTDTGYHQGSMAALKDTLLGAGANTYYFHVRQASDVDSLKVFLPLAQTNSINVWVYMAFKSVLTTANITPMVDNYKLWADTIAHLSVTYPVIEGYSIDDFWDQMPTPVTIAHIDSMIDVGKAINPNLKFYPLTYFGQVNKPYTDGDLASVIDGMIVAYPRDSLSIVNALLEAQPHSRVKVEFPSSTASSVGQYGRITKRATITNPDSVTLTFHYSDSYDGATTGYHHIQLAIDSLESANLIPSASSDFATDGSAWWNGAFGTKTYNSDDQTMTVVWNGTNGLYGVNRGLLLVTGHSYRITFRARSSNVTYTMFKSGYGVVGVTNPALSTEWQNYVGTITGGTTLTIYVNGGASGADLEIDDIVVTENASANLVEVWANDLAGVDDSTVTIDLKSSVTGRDSFLVGIGVYEKGAVGNLRISGFISKVEGYGITIDTNLTAWTDTVSGSFTVTQAPSQGNVLPLIVMLPGDEDDWVLFYSDTSSTFESRLRTILNFYPTVEGSTTWWLEYAEPNFYDALKRVYLSY